MKIPPIVTRTGYLVLLGSAVMWAASLNNADKQFLMTAAKNDMTLAHEGQMAQNQATRADLKDFGKTLVQDHSMSYWQLSQLASKEGVAIPKGINVSHDRNIEQLGHLKGANFDRQFASDEVTTDRQMLTAFRREAKDGKDSDVKAYANKMIPVLQKHLQTAEQFSKPTRKS